MLQLQDGKWATRYKNGLEPPSAFREKEARCCRGALYLLVDGSAALDGLRRLVFIEKFSSSVGVNRPDYAANRYVSVPWVPGEFE
jgi:hypothetical protein